MKISLASWITFSVESIYNMENLMVIRVEVIAPENPLDSDYNICKRLEITQYKYDQ